MKACDYDAFVDELWIDGPENEAHALFGLVAEVGEVFDILQKQARGDEHVNMDYDFAAQRFKKELGDVLYYFVATCHQFGWSLGDIMQDNVRKLRSRQERGVVKGQGDDR